VADFMFVLEVRV